MVHGESWLNVDNRLYLGQYIIKVESWLEVNNWWCMVKVESWLVVEDWWCMVYFKVGIKSLLCSTRGRAWLKLKVDLKSTIGGAW